jgi:hypothetical protein
MIEPAIFDVSQDWATACDVQQRFMHQQVPPLNGFCYGARCRLLRALGGDCYDLLPAAVGPSPRFRDRRRLREKPSGGAHDRECPVVATYRYLCPLRTVLS